MIARAEFDAYSRASAKLAQDASDLTYRAVMSYADQHPGASVEEVREFSRRLLEGVNAKYCAAAGELAARWYDERGAGRGLDRAVIEQTWSADQAERVARYQARKLESGAVPEFARACGEYAANSAKRSLNATVLANAKRDRRRGVKFARVPTGAETCTFCAMLASRGAVYATPRAAGEQNHYHRGCDCKIVASFGDDDLVEGYDPEEWAERWHEMEAMDEDWRLTPAQRDAAKARIAAGGQTGAIDRSADAYKGVPDKYLDVVDRIVAGASGKAKELYMKYEKDFPETGLDPEGSYYDPKTKKVFFDDLDKVFGGNGKEPSDTWFHEFGHALDWILGNGKSYAETWRGGALQRQVQAEVKDYAATRVKDADSVARSIARSGDHGAVKFLWLRWKLVDTATYTKWLAGAINSDQLAGSLDKATIVHAYKLIEAELDALPQDETVAVSDMFDGATHHAVKDSWYHTNTPDGKEYWGKDGRALAHEAFAELFACHLSSPKAFARMKEYLPKSCALFEELLSDAAGVTI